MRVAKSNPMKNKLYKWNELTENEEPSRVLRAKQWGNDNNNRRRKEKNHSNIVLNIHVHAECWWYSFVSLCDGSCALRFKINFIPNDYLLNSTSKRKPKRKKNMPFNKSTKTRLDTKVYAHHWYRKTKQREKKIIYLNIIILRFGSNEKSTKIRWYQCEIIYFVCIE